MEFRVGFENSQLVIQQNVAGRSVSASVHIQTVPKLNNVLEKYGLPNLFQWASYGLDLLPIAKIMISGGAINLL